MHVPNAGAPGKNVISFPLNVSSREDFDLTYQINDYKIYPIVVPNIDSVELSYNKREGIIADSKARLYEAIASDIAHSWISGAKPVAKGEKTIKNMVLEAAKKFATDKVPMEGRSIMLTPEGYYSLLDSLTSQEQFAFSTSADASKGVLGRYMSFEFVSEFFLPKNVEMMAWHPIAVSRAIGEVNILSSEKDPTYFGDVISGEMRAGGSVIRKDIKGIYVVDAEGVKDEAPKQQEEDINVEE